MDRRNKSLQTQRGAWVRGRTPRDRQPPLGDSQRCGGESSIPASRARKSVPRCANARSLQRAGLFSSSSRGRKAAGQIPPPAPPVTSILLPRRPFPPGLSGLISLPSSMDADQGRGMENWSVYPLKAAGDRVAAQLDSRSRRSLLQGSRSHASRAFRSRTAFRAGLCCRRREQMSP